MLETDGGQNAWKFSYLRGSKCLELDNKELEKYLHPIDTVIDNKYYVSLIKVDQ